MDCSDKSFMCNSRPFVLLSDALMFAHRLFNCSTLTLVLRTDRTLAFQYLNHIFSIFSIFLSVLHLFETVSMLFQI